MSISSTSFREDETLKKLHNVRNSDHLEQQRHWPKYRTLSTGGRPEVMSRGDASNATCAPQKTSPQKTSRVPMRTHNIGAPLECIAVDVLKPVPVSEKNKYIFVVANYFSKWAEGFAIPNQETEKSAGFITEEFVS